MTRRLIVSFIGRVDLAYFGLDDRTLGAEDLSPVLRLLNHLAAEGRCPPQRTRLLLFDDDKPGADLRQRFCERLQATLREVGLGELPLQRCPVKLPGGPTDVHALYEQVFATLPTSSTVGPEAADEVIFHISPGTWAMQSTLVLAASCLPLKAARLYETSAQQQVKEVRLPYVLFSREVGRSRPGGAKLGDKARASLLEGTVVRDAAVEEAYGLLHRAATGKGAPALVVQGPSGSGKWHAARQFAHWRGGPTVEWLKPAALTAGLPVAATVLIWRLDAWPADGLRALAAWRAARGEHAVVATWRTDMPAAASLLAVARDGLRGAVHLRLPALSARADIVELAEAVAQRNGVRRGKIKQRLQVELGTDVYSRNLHDLKQVLLTAAFHSRGSYPDGQGYARATQVADAVQAEDVLRQAFDTLANLRFGPGRPDLKHVLDVVQKMVVQMAIGAGRTQDEAARLLGYAGQSSISDIVQREVDLGPWVAPAAADDPAA